MLSDLRGNSEGTKYLMACANAILSHVRYVHARVEPGLLLDSYTEIALEAVDADRGREYR